MFELPSFQMPKAPKLPEIKWLDLTVDQVKSMSDADLLKILSGESELDGTMSMPVQQLITSELLSRGIAKGSKPQWSVVPSFWLLVLTAILAFVAAVAAVISLPQAQRLIQPPASATSPAQRAPQKQAPPPSSADNHAR
jgi:hypothetical protein